MIQIRRGVFETNSSSTHALVYRSKKESLTESRLIPDYYCHVKPNHIDINFGIYQWTRETPLTNWNEKLNYLMTWIAIKVLSSLQDDSYIPVDEYSDYQKGYLWNEYNDKDAQARWDKACSILDSSEEVQQLKELFKRHCDFEFEGFSYCWWSEGLDRWDFKEIFKHQKNRINHPYWHKDNYKFHDWPRPDGVEHFTRFGGIDHQTLEDADVIRQIEQEGFEKFLFSDDILIIIDNDNH